MTRPTIAVFTKNRLNPAYHAARLGADRVAERMGATTVHYVPQRPDNVDEQRLLVDEALAARPSAAVFVPVHGTLMDDWAHKLTAAGVPVFNMINQLDRADDYVTYVGSDNHRLAALTGAFLYRAMGGRGDVVILEGTPGTITSRERLRGFEDAAQAWPGIRIVGSREGMFLFEKGRLAMQALLADLPRIDGVAATNDSMALGALEALDAAARHAHVVGINAIPDAVAAIKAGRLLASADFDAMKISCIATEAALRHLRGEAVPKEILLPVQVVHRGNCAQYDLSLEAREAPSWESVVR
ncbi:MAG: sugar ABC transporter substrate-binding protein [Proteobacteria bacterium]|nr:sugar ABC transporter substrate-binding protein [Burkholderiales bacterium]